MSSTPLPAKTPPPLPDAQAERVTRALRDYKKYHFFEAYTPCGRWRWYDCYSGPTGETYEVTPFDCTCWDYVARCRENKWLCKHILMLEMALQKGEVKRLPLPLPQRRAE